MTTRRQELEAWLREPMPTEPRERAQEEAARALVKGGQEGALSWTQVYLAMEVIEDAGSARRLDRVESVYEALQGTGKGDGAEDEPTDGLGPTLGRGAARSDEERVARELSAEVEHAMSMENRAAYERAVIAREDAGTEMERVKLFPGPPVLPGRPDHNAWTAPSGPPTLPTAPAGF
jgi:hypothetical protein